VPIQAGGFASLGVTLPVPNDAGPESLPGTVNIVRNPSVEHAGVGLTDWTPRGAATIERVTDLGWQGGASVRATVAADVAGQGVQVVTLGGLGMTGDRTLLGSAYVFGPVEGLGARLIALYGDGSVGTGPTVPVPTDTPSEWVRVACAIEPDPAKVLNQLVLAIDRTSGNLLVDGGFESGTAGWTASAATLATDAGAGNFVQGTRSLKVTQAGTFPAARSPLVTGLIPGQVYTLSAWVKGAAGTAVNFGYDDTSVAASTNYPMDGTWKRLAVQRAARDPGPGSTPNALRIQTEGLADYWIDGAMITLGDEIPSDFSQPGGSFWVDAAQVEEDRGWGHTPFATGQYGAPYHYWWGTEYLSPSVRDGMPLDGRQSGSAGEYAMKATLWRSNADNERLEDLSEHVIAATVSCSTERDVSWTMTLRLTDAGWKRLRPWRDWLAPVLSVTDAAGVESVGQLGHYVVLPSAAEHREWTSEWDVDCRSPEYLLSIQAFKGKVKVTKGSNLLKAARWVLNTAAMGEGNNGRPRFRLPDGNRKAEDEYEYRRTDSKLSIANELLEAAGCMPLYANRAGVLLSDRAADRKYRERQPVRLWAANFDPDSRRDEDAVERWARRLPSSNDEVGMTVRQLPRLGRAENKIVVLTTDSRRARRKGSASIDHPSNPIGVRWTNRERTRHVKRRMIPDDATARELARALAEEIGTKIDRVELSVVPDPQVDLLNEVVYLAVYRLDGGRAAVGRFRVLGVEYGFTPDAAMMKLTLGFVHAVDELAGTDALYFWDDRTQSFRRDDGAPLVLVLP
jgi:hypothetical protein